MVEFFWFIIKFIICLSLFFIIAFVINPNYLSTTLKIIFILFLGYYLYPGYNNFEYDHLIKRSLNRQWTPRILDNGDKMPEDIYCLENDDEIKNILLDKEFIDEMLITMENYNTPCISSFHLKKRGEEEKPMPSFIILNNRFHFPSKFDVSYYPEKYHYIFNPKKIGSTVNKNAVVRTRTSLCKWPKETPLNKAYRNYIEQINCKMGIVYNNEMYIMKMDLLYTGELAYCLQDFWNESTNTNSICN